MAWLGLQVLSTDLQIFYSQLYNTHGHGDEFEQLSSRIYAGVEHSSLAQVDLIPPSLVKEALKKSLKKSKNDAIFRFQ